MQLLKQETHLLSMDESEFQSLVEAINNVLDNIAQHAQYYICRDSIEQYLIPVEYTHSVRRYRMLH